MQLTRPAHSYSPPLSRLVLGQVGDRNDNNGFCNIEDIMPKLSLLYLSLQVRKGRTKHSPTCFIFVFVGDCFDLRSRKDEGMEFYYPRQCCTKARCSVVSGEISNGPAKDLRISLIFASACEPVNPWLTSQQPTTVPVRPIPPQQ